jgi:type II secretory pathway component PulF
MSTDAPDNPLDYASADAAPAISSMPLFAAYFIVYVLVGGVLFTTAPKFERLYAENKMELPALTAGVMSFARWFRNGGWWMLLPIPIVMPAIVTRVARNAGAVPSRRRHRRLFGVAGFLALLAGVIILIAMILPYMSNPDRIANPTG